MDVCYIQPRATHGKWILANAGCAKSRPISLFFGPAFHLWPSLPPLGHVSPAHLFSCPRFPAPPQQHTLHNIHSVPFIFLLFSAPHFNQSFSQFQLLKSSPNRSRRSPSPAARSPTHSTLDRELCPRSPAFATLIQIFSHGPPALLFPRLSYQSSYITHSS
ncbi:hypothetical protein QCA50_004249 [Cerrena zonata]|uniref:Uncharacterized protein n=1 Tax=Cerrena zonata TaxID=2478898 RepID=A0AAW0GIX7_9APHY